MVKRWHKISNYSISEQELRMFSTRQSIKKISYMPEIQIWVEVIQVAPVVMGKQERKEQGNEESMIIDVVTFCGCARADNTCQFWWIHVTL
jgi:hypothetical protein